MTDNQIIFLIVFPVLLLGLQVYVTIDTLKEGNFEKKSHFYFMCIPFSMYILLAVVVIVEIWDWISKLLNFKQIKEEFKKLD